MEADAHAADLPEEWLCDPMTNAYTTGSVEDVGMDIFQRGLCLPSDNKMTEEQQDKIIEVIKACFE